MNDDGTSHPEYGKVVLDWPWNQKATPMPSDQFDAFIARRRAARRMQHILPDAREPQSSSGVSLALPGTSRVA